MIAVPPPPGVDLWRELFTGVPLWAQIVFFVVLANSLFSFISVFTLCIAGSVARRRRRRPSDGGGESDYLWLFLVPALNEEMTIADSVQRLTATRATHRLIVPIDDGSDDATAAILGSQSRSDLTVISRTLPDARAGKAAALNHAYRMLCEEILPSARFAGWSADRVIVGVVDADGRLDAGAPDRLAWHFDDERVGGVQCLVHIYNRRSALTWAQELEFSAFGLVFQLGRTVWGTANMGGNGQFNRLSALTSIAGDEGPWRDRLTEDQDLGVRLVQAGWQGRQEISATIDQQGLNSLRRLYRQRTRWAQGAWQALTLLRGSCRAQLAPLARIDAVYYLLTPLSQLITGIGLAVAIVLSAMRGIGFLPSDLLLAIAFLTLSFAPMLVTLLIRARGVADVAISLLLVLPYTLYTWITFPVLALGLLHQLRGRRSWAKTDREPLEPAIACP